MSCRVTSRDRHFALASCISASVISDKSGSSKSTLRILRLSMTSSSVASKNSEPKTVGSMMMTLERKMMRDLKLAPLNVVSTI